jgi:predicted Zn-dependent protease
VRFSFFILAAALAGTAAAAETLPELGDTSRTVLTGPQERLLGEQIMRQVRALKQYVDDPEISDYINDIGFKLAANSPDAQHAFEFFAIEDKTINAFALPGGFIGVHTGRV